MKNDNFDEIKKYFTSYFPKLKITNEMLQDNIDVIGEIFNRKAIDNIELKIINNELKIIWARTLIADDTQSYTQKPQLEKNWLNWKLNTNFIRKTDYAETVKLVSYLLEYTNDDKKELNECIYIYGPITSGKTRRSVAFANQLLINRNNQFSTVKHVKVEYIHLKNFIDDLQSLKSFGQTLTPEVLEILKRVITDTDLLIVDDVDFIHNRVENLYEICSKLETRMQSCKATIFIANYSLAELKKRFVTKLPKYREFYERFFDRMIIKTKNRVFFVDKLNR